MKVIETIKAQIDRLEPGKLITYKELKVSEGKFEATAKALSRLNKEGVIQRLSKGIYYKPKQTPFGVIKPSESEVIKQFTISSGKTIGYVTGTSVYNRLGLTTQIPNEIIIATNKPKRPIKINGLKVRFKVNNNRINSQNIDKLQLLDAIKDLKEIPDNDLNSALSIIIKKVKNLDPDSRKKLYTLAFKYNPATRALFGSIVELIENPLYCRKLKETLNQLTKYKIGVSESILPNKKAWNIE